VEASIVRKLAARFVSDDGVDLDLACALADAARLASSSLLKIIPSVKGGAVAGEDVGAAVRPYGHVAGGIFTDLERPLGVKFPSLTVGWGN
jgi:hypothetical protein